jgi:surface protein
MDPTAATRDGADDNEPTESTVEIVFEGANPAAEPDVIVDDSGPVVAAKAAILSAQQHQPLPVVVDGPEVDESDDYVEFETECPPQESSPLNLYLNDIDHFEDWNDPVVSAQSATAFSTDTPEEREYYINEALQAVSRAEPMDAAAVTTTPHSNKNHTKLLVAWIIMVAVLIATVAGVATQSSSSLSSPKNAASSPSSDGGKAFVAFTTTQQLYDAVDAYLAELEQNGTVAVDSPVSRQYGYPMGTWDVSRITHFDRVFDPNRTQVLDHGRAVTTLSTALDEDLSGWDLSNAVSLWGMFAGAGNFTGRGLSYWNVAKVTNFSYTFAWASRFNGNVSSWDTASATTMECMFFNALTFNRDVSGFVVDNVESMRSMFENAAEFQGLGHLEKWDVSNVQTMNSTFAGCSNFQGNVSSWDTSNVTVMDYMVRSAVLAKEKAFEMLSRFFLGSRSFIRPDRLTATCRCGMWPRWNPWSKSFGKPRHFPVGVLELGIRAVSIA